MLFEKISYEEDLPVEITIANIRQYPLHYHQDTEFVVVIKGEILLKNGYCTYHLKAGDVFTNAGHEVHSLLSTNEDNMVAVIHVSTQYFSRYFPYLTKACFRTYTNRNQTPRHTALREKLLHILLTYLVKGVNYRSECSYMMVDVIKYMEKYFNLFAFDDGVVVNFDSQDQITTDRISRIINYIYEFHAQPITLNDLAEMEHLSTFYLSHIIKNCTGMSFREFLCFARVEWSEISLLETNHKISRIAREVGFSTTSYYVKYFERWHGTDPQTYREQNLPLVLSADNPGELLPLNQGNMISVIKRALSTLNADSVSDALVSVVDLNLDINANAPGISSVSHHLDLHITLEDFNVLGYEMFVLISDLHPDKVTILTRPGDKPSELSRIKILLSTAGFPVDIGEQIDDNEITSYGYDSIAYPLFIFQNLLKSRDNWIRVRLRDPGESVPMIKGFPAVLTSGGIRKPVFYPYKALSSLSGEVIYWGAQYCVLRIPGENGPVLLALAYNTNDSISSLCLTDASEHFVKDTLNDFKDELNISMIINMEEGLYNVYKYSMSRTDGIFAYLTALDFPEDPVLLRSHPGFVTTQPKMSVYVEDVRTTMDMNFTFQGAGIGVAVITPQTP